MHALVEELIAELPAIQERATVKVAQERKDEQDRPYDPTTRVSRMVDDLEFEQFRNPDDRERLNEIRALAREQVLDDRDNQAGEVYWNKMTGHGTNVGPTPYFNDENDKFLWRERSENQRALELGMEPFLEQLSGEQRVLVRFRYGTPRSEYDIAKQLGVTRASIQGRLRTINKQLRAAMLAASSGGEDTDGSGA